MLLSFSHNSKSNGTSNHTLSLHCISIGPGEELYIQSSNNGNYHSGNSSIGGGGGHSNLQQHHLHNQHQHQQHHHHQHSQNNNTSSITNVPSSLSVQQLSSVVAAAAAAAANNHNNHSVGSLGGSSGTSTTTPTSAAAGANATTVPHSQSAHEIGGQVPMTPLVQHQQALHHQLQMRFAAAAAAQGGSTGSGSGEWCDLAEFFLYIMGRRRHQFTSDFVRATALVTVRATEIIWAIIGSFDILVCTVTSAEYVRIRWLSAFAEFAANNVYETRQNSIIVELMM